MKDEFLPQAQLYVCVQIFYLILETVHSKEWLIRTVLVVMIYEAIGETETIPFIDGAVNWICFINYLNL